MVRGPSKDEEGPRTELIFPKDGIEVILPLPEEMSFGTQYDWSVEEFGGIEGAVGLWRKTRSKNVTQDDFTGVFARNLAAGTGRMGDYYQKATRSAVNPKEAVIFRGPKHRSYSLTFNLADVSSRRMKQKIERINMLLRAAAPRGSDFSHFWEYPSMGELTIFGVGGGKVINTRQVAVTGITPNLTPDGTFATYADGTPVHINLSIELHEVNLPFKENGEGELFPKSEGEG